MKTETETTLREAIMAASEALDPMHQGVCWPDPIEWDGRPLEEQAGDLLTLMQTRLRDADDMDAEPLERAYDVLDKALSVLYLDRLYDRARSAREVYDAMHRTDAG